MHPDQIRDMSPADVREWRRRHKLTRLGLGQLAGTSPRTVENWETAKSPVPHAISTLCVFWAETPMGQGMVERVRAIDGCGK